MQSRDVVLALSVVIGSCSAPPKPILTALPPSNSTTLSASSPNSRPPLPASIATEPAHPAPGSFEFARSELLSKQPQTVEDLRAVVGGVAEKCRVVGWTIPTNREKAAGKKKKPFMNECVWTLPSRGGPKELSAVIDEKGWLFKFTLDGVEHDGAWKVIGVVE